MGDRSNLFVQMHKRPDDEWDGIGLYAHWDGEDLHKVAIEVLPRALARMGDEAYFARILIHNVLHRLADPTMETGHGLWIDHPCDNEYDILVINALTGEYWMTDPESYRKDKGA